MPDGPHPVPETPDVPSKWSQALLIDTPIARHHAPLEFSSLPAAGADPAATARAARFLYLSHFLSAWGVRAWEFLVGLVMLELASGSSLLLVSLFGLVDALALVILSGAIGKWLDSHRERLPPAVRMYMLQNISVGISAAACLSLLWRRGDHAAATQDLSVSNNVLYWLLVGIAMSAGAASSLGATGATLSVEREWTKALCGSDSAALARTNAVMKRIDLSCLILSPIAVGMLMTWRLDAAVLCVLAWHVAAWVPECGSLKRAQQLSPLLAAAKENGPVNFIGEGPLSWQQGGKQNQWSVYFQQAIAPAAFSLALLYFTVMSFGTLMTAYLKYRGLSESILAIFRGLGALCGIAATVAFPAMHRRIGLMRAGAVAVWLQLLCLALGLGFQLLVGSSSGGSSRIIGLYGLIAGLTLSRFGLWAFDLSVNQVLQEATSPDILGAVTGVQSSLQSAFQLASFAVGIALPQPEQFPVLMVGSVVIVGGAATLYTIALVKWRGMFPSSLGQDGVLRPETPISP